MRCLFKDNIQLAQLVLRIITDKPDLVITELETQRDLKKLMGARSICLDAYGTDSQGKKYDLEIQRSERGADPHRDFLACAVCRKCALYTCAHANSLCSRGRGATARKAQLSALAGSKQKGRVVTIGVSEVSAMLDEMREESRIEGIKEGEEKKALNAAMKMLADGSIPIEKIAEFLGLSIQKVEEIESNIIS